MLLIRKTNTILKTNKGFTLVELMIVVGIVAILATIAIPSYQNYVVRSNRAQALGVLQANMLALEQFRTRNMEYPTNAQISSGSVTGYLSTLSINISSGAGYDIAYNLVGTEVTLTMSPNSVWASNETLCNTITLNSNEVQTAKDKDGKDTSTECWANNR